MSYIGNRPNNPQIGPASSTTITATTLQTVFSIAYTPGFVTVFQNGALLVPFSDYTTNAGTSVTLVTGATVGDELTFIVGNAVANGEVVTATTAAFATNAANATLAETATTATNSTTAATATNALSLGGALAADYALVSNSVSSVNGAAGEVTGIATLAANTFTGAQIMSDQRLSRSLLVDTGYPVFDKGNSGTATQTYDYTQGSIQTATATGSHTVAFSNFPPTGNLGELLFILTNGGAFTVTWPGSILWMKPDGTTTSSISVYLAANSGRTALQTSGVDQFFFWTRDAGTTIYGKLV
jgi:hypothetical protein